jgi:hypothetical protein
MFILIGLAVALILIIGFVLSMGIAFVGWVVSLVYPLSAWQGTLVAMVMGVGAGLALYFFYRDLPLIDALLSQGPEEEQRDTQARPTRRKRSRRP